MSLAAEPQPPVARLVRSWRVACRRGAALGRAYSALERVHHRRRARGVLAGERTSLRRRARPRRARPPPRCERSASSPPAALGGAWRPPAPAGRPSRRARCRASRPRSPRPAGRTAGTRTGRPPTRGVAPITAAERATGYLEAVHGDVVAARAAEPGHGPGVEDLHVRAREEHEPRLHRAPVQLREAAADEPVAEVAAAGEGPAPGHLEPVARRPWRDRAARTRRPPPRRRCRTPRAPPPRRGRRPPGRSWRSRPGTSPRWRPRGRAPPRPRPARAAGPPPPERARHAEAEQVGGSQSIHDLGRQPALALRALGVLRRGGGDAGDGSRRVLRQPDGGGHQLGVARRGGPVRQRRARPRTPRGCRGRARPRPPARPRWRRRAVVQARPSTPRRSSVRSMPRRPATAVPGSSPPAPRGRAPAPAELAVGHERSALASLHSAGLHADAGRPQRGGQRRRRPPRRGSATRSRAARAGPRADHRRRRSGSSPRSTGRCSPPRVRPGRPRGSRRAPPPRGSRRASPRPVVVARVHVEGDRPAPRRRSPRPRARPA